MPNRLSSAPRLVRAACLIAWAVAAVGCAGGRSSPRPLTDDARYQRETLGYLASPQLEGRGPGTRGLDLAADYIAEEFRKAGLQPVPGLSTAPGNAAYFQPFEFNLGLKVDPATALTVGSTRLALGSDFLPNSITARDKAFSGDVVFAGYGVASKQYGYDDYAGLDVKGKVVLFLRFEPRTADGKASRFTQSEEWSAEAALARKILAAQSRGAAGVLFVTPPPVAGAAPTDDTLSPFSARGPRGGVSIPVFQITRAAADRVLSTAGTKLAQLAAPIDAAGTPASKPLPGLTAAGEVRLAKNSVWVKNVMAVLPGSGPLKDEYVVVGSHYDHLGAGGSGSLAPGVTALHPGADDNASGTTAMLTLARRLGGSGYRPNRSVLFQAYTMEEQGLIGSQYFVDNPPASLPLSSLAYMLNLDMVGRLKNDTIIYGGEGTAPTLQAVLDAALAGSGLTSKSMGKGGFGPSDHASFARKRIPVLFLFTGLHPQYHRPADKPDTINYPGLLTVTNLAERILKGLADAPRAAYDVDSDQFRQNINRADSLTPAATPADRPAGERVGLGLMPDMTLRDGGGMRIDGVAPGSAAARAGLVAEDVLLELDGTPINSVEDLQAVYDRHKPGDKVRAKYLRAGKAVSTELTFSRRGGNN